MHVANDYRNRFNDIYYEIHANSPHTSIVCFKTCNRWSVLERTGFVRISGQYGADSIYERFLKSPLAKLNTLRPRQHGRYFADNIFKYIFLNENARISLKKSLKFVPKFRIHNIPALVQIMAWRRSLSEPMVVSLLTYVCVARPQWVNTLHTAVLSEDIDIYSQFISFLVVTPQITNNLTVCSTVY